MKNVAVALALLLLFSQPSYPDGIFNGGSGGGGGGSGTVTSIATGCQATGGTITTSGTISTQFTLSASSPVSSSSYALVAADSCHDVLLAAGNTALTIASAATTGFGNGVYWAINNQSGGSVTLTPTTSTIDGGSSVTITNNCTYGFQSDGTNYHATQICGSGSVTASSTTTFTNKTLTSSTNSLGGVTAAYGSDAKGDIYTNGGSSNVVTRLAIGSTGNCLVVASSLPSWAACPAGTITAGTTATSGVTSGNLLGSASNLVTDSGVPYSNFPVSGTVNGDVVEYSNTTGSLADSGVLLSSLAPKASPTFSGTVNGAAFVGTSFINNSTNTGSIVNEFGAKNSSTNAAAGANMAFGNSISGNMASLQINSSAFSGGAGPNGFTVATAASATNSFTTGNVYVITGNSTGTTANSGNIVVAPGTATGTAGTIALDATTSVSCASGLQTSSAGVLSCVASKRSIKNPLGDMKLAEADNLLDRLRPAVFTYKDQEEYPSGERVGFYADDICEADERLCERDGHGAVMSYDVRGVAAALAIEVKELKSEIEDLKRRVER